MASLHWSLPEDQNTATTVTMDFDSRLLFQIDEAGRYIGDARLERLRLALLLLDNAAEMLLAAHIKSAFIHERWSERLKQQWEEMAHLGNLPDAGKEALAFQPLTKREKANIERVFEEKIKYVSVREKVMPQHLVAPLLHLHQYRNETYHRNEIRSDTIRMACLILFEIVCDLALILHPSTVSYDSDADYSWLQERFGWSRRDLYRSRRDEAIELLRLSVLPTTEELSSVLASYMMERFGDFYQGLESLMENLGLDTKESALAAVFQFRADSIQNAVNETPKKALEPRTTDWIEAIRARIPSIREASTRVEAFQRFAELECEIEPIETALGEFNIEIDAYIDLQVDIARGK